jgi:hypothetical protein
MGFFSFFPVLITLPEKFSTKALEKAFQSSAAALNPVQ